MAKALRLLSPLRSLPPKCIKTSWKQDRIFNRCFFMESGHDLSLSTKTISSNRLFFTPCLRLLNVSQLSVLSVLLSYAMSQERCTHFEPISTQKTFLWGESMNRKWFTFSKSDHITLLLTLDEWSQEVCLFVLVRRNLEGNYSFTFLSCVGQRAKSATEQLASCW